MRVVICGGGVIGACTAYFLSRRGIEVIVVERTEVAAAASGKAGGFLALDWCAGTPLDALARRSFELHAAAGRARSPAIGAIDPMTAYSGFVASERDARRHAPSGLDWLADGVIIAGRIGTPETTAIVHPQKIHLRHDEPPPSAAAPSCAADGSPALSGTRMARLRRASRSTAASSRRTPSSSPWDHGRCWLPNGCRCPRCSGREVQAWSTTPAAMSLRMRCSSNITTSTAAPSRSRCFRARTAARTSPRFSERARRCRSIPPP